MKLLGVTGGIGMGKTTVAEMLGQLGVAVLDTDAISRQLTQPGEPALAEIAAAFGPSVLQSDGSLNRAALARCVFQDSAARARLESILHPPIRAVWSAETERWKASGQALGAVIIPLLFETGAAAHFDAVICVACSAATQEKRLTARGWTLDHIAARLAAQWPIEKKLAQSDLVIWTDTTLEATRAQLEKVIDSVGTARKIPACA